MPAVLMVNAADNPVPDDPGKWLAGEVVANIEVTHQFGWYELPINAQGQADVATINGLDINAVPLYGAYLCADGGVITSGNGDDVGVIAGEVIVKQFGGIWNNFGARTVPAAHFYHIRVSDKTVPEVAEYLEAYNQKLEYTVDQFNPVDDMRRWTTTNVRVSASGNNGFTAQGITDAITEWNTNHPSNTVTLVDTDNLTYFQVEGIMPAELYDEWQQNSQEVALSNYYARRRWYITSAGLTALASNDGIISGTASEVSPFLRDGLLD